MRSIADAPRPFVFRFQPGDELAVDVYGEKELAIQQRVQQDGTVAPPILGRVDVAGRSVDDIQGILAHRYREYVRDPKVSVRVVSIYSDRVFVLGEVKLPQAVPMLGPVTLLQSVTLAGGFAEEFAEKEEVRLIRKGPQGYPQIYVVNTKAVLAGRAADLPLQRGDIVYVPARGVTNFARTLGQALSPISTAIGTAGTVATAAFLATN